MSLEPAPPVERRGEIAALPPHGLRGGARKAWVFFVSLPERITGSRILRALLAVALLLGHFHAMTVAGKEWLKLDFNSRPTAPPVLPPGRVTLDRVENVTRLLSSRWDSGHYIPTALRGFDLCPPQDTKAADLKALNDLCDFKFYPTYPWLGRKLSVLTGAPVDFTLMAVTLAASLLLLFLWTGPAIVTLIGAPQTLLSLFLFSIFPSAFHLITVHTESLTILTGFAAFIALRKKSYFWGAVIAGASTGVHFRAVGFGLAYGGALLASFMFDRPQGRRAMAARLAGLVFSVWGIVALWGYYGINYGDALLYVHSVESGRWVPPPYDGTYVAAFFLSMRPPFAGPVLMLVGLAAVMGVRSFLRDLPASEKVFAVLAVVLMLGIPLVSRKGDFMGIQRYVLCAFPVFFMVARAFRGRWLALSGWTVLSTLHLWHVELCLYLTHTTSVACDLWRF
jgi:hypothetical protein